MRRFLCSRNPHFRKWSFDGRSRNHLTAPHEMGVGSGGCAQLGSSQPPPSEKVGEKRIRFSLALREDPGTHRNWLLLIPDRGTGPVVDLPTVLAPRQVLKKRDGPLVSFARATHALRRASLDARSWRPNGPPLRSNEILSGRALRRRYPQENGYVIYRYSP